MLSQAIEPGQRLQMQIGKTSATVSAISEAVVPAGYWLCHDESCGQKRVVAASVLFPIAIEPPAVLSPAVI